MMYTLRVKCATVQAPNIEGFLQSLSDAINPLPLAWRAVKWHPTLLISLVDCSPFHRSGSSRSGLQPNRLEALTVLALDDGFCRLGVIGEGQRFAVPVQRLAGILGCFDREKPGLGAADALLERAPVVRRVDAQAFIDPGVPVIHALVLG